MGCGCLEGVAEQLDAGLGQGIGLFPPLLKEIACCFHLDICKEELKYAPDPWVTKGASWEQEENWLREE